LKIRDIAVAIEQSKVLITDHADEEAQADKLSFEEVYFSVLHGEIVEDYPTDTPYPSCLVYGDTFSGDPVHSVWGYNKGSGWSVLITVYRPAPDRWTDDWKTRR
jgi:ribosomal protein L24